MKKITLLKINAMSESMEELKEFIDGCKTIADFMGIDYRTLPNGEKRYFRELDYHRSYDSLMPVVETIEKLVESHPFPNTTFSVHIYRGNDVAIMSNNGNYVVEVQDKETKLLTVFWAVVEFIEFYKETYKR
jgi:hypothetical protein